MILKQSSLLKKTSPCLLLSWNNNTYRIKRQYSIFIPETQHLKAIKRGIC